MLWYDIMIPSSFFTNVGLWLITQFRFILFNWLKLIDLMFKHSEVILNFTRASIRLDFPLVWVISLLSSFPIFYSILVWLIWADLNVRGTIFACFFAIALFSCVVVLANNRLTISLMIAHCCGKYLINILLPSLKLFLVVNYCLYKISKKLKIL